MAEYGIWLSFNNQKEGFQIPINPEKIEISSGSDGKTYDVFGLGNINVIKSPKLMEYSFSGIFPAQEYPFLSTKLVLNPMKYVRDILKWQASKRPIRFIFCGSHTFYNSEGEKISEINTPASIESFDWKEVAGSVGDIEYSIKLKEYKFYDAKKVEVVETQPNGKKTMQKKPPKRPDDRQTPKTYKLKSGDTLQKLSKKFFGTTARAKEIQKLNGIKDSQLKKLQIGQVIKLPGGEKHA